MNNQNKQNKEKNKSNNGLNLFICCTILFILFILLAVIVIFIMINTLSDNLNTLIDANSSMIDANSTLIDSNSSNVDTINKTIQDMNYQLDINDGIHTVFSNNVTVEGVLTAGDVSDVESAIVDLQTQPLSSLTGIDVPTLIVDGDSTLNGIENTGNIQTDSLNDISSDTIGYISTLTSDAQTQLDLCIKADDTNIFTGTNTFNTELTSFPNSTETTITDETSGLSEVHRTESLSIDTLGLIKPYYRSGWFVVSVNSTNTIIHNLNLQQHLDYPFRYTVLFSASTSSPSVVDDAFNANIFDITGQQLSYQHKDGYSICLTTPNEFKIVTGVNTVAMGYAFAIDGDGDDPQYQSYTEGMYQVYLS